MQEDSAPVVLRARGITKRFPGVLALDGVDFELRAGEVHVLFGENGAGKSTLISLLSGANQPDAGEIELDGELVHLSSVATARTRGISAVYQEFSLAPSMTVVDNVVLGSEPTRMGLVDHREARRLTLERLDELGFELDPDAVAESLSRAEQQMVEIAAAFRSGVSVLILDEPTASLIDQESERLFELVDEARRRGLGIIYITHRMPEIRRLADRITVLRDGRYIATVPGSASDDELISLMTGRPVEALYPELPDPGTEPVVKAQHLTTRNKHMRAASFEIRAGEIVGFAGLAGSGKSTAARACFGLERLDAGTVHVLGEDRTGATPMAMLKAGVMYLPNDRKREGLFLDRAMRESVTLPWLTNSRLARGGLLRLRRERAEARAMLERLELTPPDPERPAASFSGGNQQKGLLGRALMGDCRVYLLDEPSVGVDVGARVAIYRQIAELAERGHAVLVVSSEMNEILHLCHRAYVFSQGRVAAMLDRDELTEEAILRHMMHWDDPDAGEAA